MLEIRPILLREWLIDFNVLWRQGPLKGVVVGDSNFKVSR